MAKSKSKEWPDSLGPLPPPGQVDMKCGWCMTGHCDTCVVSFHSAMTNKTYVCNCKHEEE
jgi:hypothetical protein